MLDALMTGPDAARLVRVKPPTIRSWAHRGLIQPAGLDERGRPLYRQLDVARAEAATRRRSGRRIPQLA